MNYEVKLTALRFKGSTTIITETLPVQARNTLNATIAAFEVFLQRFPEAVALRVKDIKEIS